MMTRRSAVSPILLTLLLAASAGAADDGPVAAPEPLIANLDGRATVSLGGTWRTIVDPYAAGLVGYHGRPLADGYFRDARPQSPSDRVGLADGSHELRLVVRGEPCPDPEGGAFGGTEIGLTSLLAFR